MSARDEFPRLAAMEASSMPRAAEELTAILNRVDGLSGDLQDALEDTAEDEKWRADMLALFIDMGDLLDSLGADDDIGQYTRNLCRTLSAKARALFAQDSTSHNAGSGVPVGQGQQ